MKGTLVLMVSAALIAGFPLTGCDDDPEGGFKASQRGVKRLSGRLNNFAGKNVKVAVKVGTSTTQGADVVASGKGDGTSVVFRTGELPSGPKTVLLNIDGQQLSLKFPKHKSRLADLSAVIPDGNVVAPEMDLGDISISPDGTFVMPQNNPFAEIDNDSDGVADFEDDDWDNDGVFNWDDDDIWGDLDLWDGDEYDDWDEDFDWDDESCGDWDTDGDGIPEWEEDDWGTDDLDWSDDGFEGYDDWNVDFCDDPNDPLCIDPNDPCIDNPDDPACVGDYCAMFPDDPACMDEYCALYPDDPACLDEYCRQNPDDPECWY